MSLSTELLDMCGQTVVVSTGPTSRTLYGEQGWSTGGSTFACHITEDHGELRRGNGEVTAYRGSVWIPSTELISTGARITLDDGTMPSIASVERKYDEDGLCATVLRLGF